MIYLSMSLCENETYGDLMEIVRGCEDIGIELNPDWEKPSYEAFIMQYKSEIKRIGSSYHEPYLGIEHSETDGIKYERAMTQMKKTIESAALLRSRYIVYHYNNERIAKEALTTRREASRNNLRKLTQYASGYGIPIVVENTGLDILGNMMFDQEAFINECQNNDENKVVFDLGHAIANRWDIPVVIKALRHKILAYHLHNNNGWEDQHKRIRDGIFDMEIFWESYRAYTPHAELVLEYLPQWIGSKQEILSDVEYIRRMSHI